MQEDALGYKIFMSIFHFSWHVTPTSGIKKVMRHRHD